MLISWQLLLYCFDDLKVLGLDLIEYFIEAFADKDLELLDDALITFRYLYKLVNLSFVGEKLAAHIVKLIQHTLHFALELLVVACSSCLEEVERHETRDVLNVAQVLFMLHLDRFNSLLDLSLVNHLGFLRFGLDSFHGDTLLPPPLLVQHFLPLGSLLSV